MMKRLFLVCAAMGLILNASCTSKSSDEGSMDEVSADAGEISDEGDLSTDSSLDAEGDGSLATELSEEGAATTDGSMAEEKPPEATAGPTDEIAPVVPEENAQIQPIVPTQPENGAAEIPPPQVAEQPVEIAPAPTESPSPSYSSSSDTTEVVESKPKPSLKKIERTPWKSGKTLLNTVYVARPKDTWKKLSNKVYNANKVSELKKSNPWIGSRELKVGDKIYYNSPNRPTDDTKVITYYEDKFLPPFTYVAQKGDNIRTVASTLLGFDNAWKEVWATNDVESKGIIAEGTELKYWKSDAAPEGALAANPSMPATTPQDPAMAAPGGLEASGEMPPTNTMPEAPLSEPTAGEMPPPPPLAETPPSMEEPPSMPPPPPPAMEPDSEPKPSQAAIQEEGSSLSKLLGNDTMTYGILGAVALLAIGALIIRNKRRQKDLEEGFQDTQVG